MAPANAFAIPGGHVYVFEALIEQANTPDELSRRHCPKRKGHPSATAVRVLLQNAGLWCGFGMLRGDFGAGGAVVIGVRTVLQASYSCESEAAADAAGARGGQTIGADPRALGAPRGGAGSGGSTEIGLTHGQARRRASAIEALAGPAGNAAGLRTIAHWTGLNSICGATPHPAGHKP